jgi:hypothetical protein
MGQQGGEGEEKTGVITGGGEPDPSFFEVPLSGFEPESDPVRTMAFFEYFKTSGQTVRWCRSRLSSRWMRMDEQIRWMDGLDGCTDWMDGFRLKWRNFCTASLKL